MASELYQVKRDGVVMCPRCLKRLKPGSIHTCSPTPFVGAIESRIKRLEAALADLIPLMEIALEAEGDTFGEQHNNATDALLVAEGLLKPKTHKEK